MWPRRVSSALERSEGVRPDQEHNRSGEGNRATSHTSETTVAAEINPIRGWR